MKVCCGNGKAYDSITGIEKLGCNHDHCLGPIEEYLFLQFCGKFNTNECTSSEDLCKLLVKADSWEDWILSQIKQEGVEKYTEWYDRMLVRGAICDGLIEAYSKLIKTEEK